MSVLGTVSLKFYGTTPTISKFDDDQVFIEGAHEDVIAYETTRYRCPFCRKSWAKKEACVDHIRAGCHKDSRTATCATCRFLVNGSSIWEGPAECAMGCAKFEQRRAERPKNCPLWQAKGSPPPTR